MAWAEPQVCIVWICRAPYFTAPYHYTDLWLYHLLPCSKYNNGVSSNYSLASIVSINSEDAVSTTELSARPLRCATPMQSSSNKVLNSKQVEATKLSLQCFRNNSIQRTDKRGENRISIIIRPTD